MTHTDPGALLKLADELIAFFNFINEPPQYEDQRMVRDYRHELARLWMPLHTKINAALAASHGSAGGERSEVRSAAQISELDDASNACLELAAKHGYATGHGDTVADMIREFSAHIPIVAQAGPEPIGWAPFNKEYGWDMSCAFRHKADAEATINTRPRWTVMPLYASPVPSASRGTEA